MEIYKPLTDQKLKYLENENVETTNVLYELSIKIDDLNNRLQVLENYLLSDGK